MGIPRGDDRAAAAAWRRARTRPAEEDGVALVMALVLMSVLTTMLATTVYFSTAAAQHASRTNAGQQAFALAEVGVNNASAVLGKAGDPSFAAAVPPESASVNGSSVAWSGSLSGATWTLTGSGTVHNPAAPGGTITHTVRKRFTIARSAAAAWAFNYSDATTGCLAVSNNAVVAAPLYVRGNLCFGNNSHFTGSQLQVRGTTTVNNGASVGSSGTPIAAAKLQGGCISGPHVCTSADSIYATSLSSTADTVAKPAVDLAGWYRDAQPGPLHSCTSGSISGGFDSNGSYDGSRPTFTLTPASSYTCVVTSGGATVGELSWDSTTRVLTISGTIFFDGPIQVSGTNTYQGQGTIYSASTITLVNNARLCGVAACDSSWNPGTNLIVLVAGASSGTGFTINNNAVYQGAAYVVADYSLVNNAANWGPVIANRFDLANNSGSFTPVAAVPSGAPGSSWTISELTGGWSD